MPTVKPEFIPKSSLYEITRESILKPPPGIKTAYSNIYYSMGNDKC